MAFLTMEVCRRYWRARPGTRGHVFPANRASRCVASVRACPRVLSLMYPSRTRALFTVLKTSNASPGQRHIAAESAEVYQVVDGKFAGYWSPANVAGLMR